MDEDVSVDSLRASLVASLRQVGTVDAVKAQLRASVIDRLRQDHGDEVVFGHLDKQRNDEPLDVKMATALVVDYLRSNQYPYTLSVFIPESGLEEIDMIARQELESLLWGYDAENVGMLANSTYGTRKSSCKKEGPLLLKMLEGKQHQQVAVGNMKDNETQTLDGDRFDGDTAGQALERKLGRVYDRYTMLMEREALAPKRTVEERMIRYQRDCDKRAEDRIKSEVNRFCSTELANMRMKERMLLRREMEHEKEKLYQEHRTKIRELNKREAQLVEQVKRRETEVEAQLYEERQTLLRKIESLSTKGEHERRSLELQNRLVKDKEAKLQEKQTEFEKKILDLSKQESELRLKFEDQTRTYRQTVLADFEERERSLQREEIRIREERAVLSREQVQYASKLDAATGISTTLQKVKEELQECIAQRDSLKTKVATFNDQMEFVKQAAQHDRDRYDELYKQYVTITKELDTVRTRHEQMMSAGYMDDREKLIGKLREQLSDTKAEMGDHIRSLENQLQEMENQRSHELLESQDRLNRSEVHLKQQNADLRDRLWAAEQDVERLTTKLEEKTAEARTLEAENHDLRKLLQQARKALDEELHERKRDREEQHHVEEEEEKVPRPARNTAFYQPPPPPPQYYPYYYPPQQMMMPQQHGVKSEDTSSELVKQLAQLQQQLFDLKQENQKGVSSISSSSYSKPLTVDTGLANRIKRHQEASESKGEVSPPSSSARSANENLLRAAKLSSRASNRSKTKSPQSVSTPKTALSSSTKRSPSSPKRSPMIYSMPASKRSPSSKSATSKLSSTRRSPSPKSATSRLSVTRRSPSPNSATSRLSSSTRRSPSPKSSMSRKSKTSPTKSKSPGNASSLGLPSPLSITRKSPGSSKASVGTRKSSPKQLSSPPRSATTPKSLRSSPKVGVSSPHSASSRQSESKFQQQQQASAFEEKFSPKSSSSTSGEDHAALLLTRQREAQERQRKLQQERLRNRQQQVEQAAQQRKREQEERERERQAEEERARRAAEEARHREAELARQREQAEELERQRQNDSIIQQYREKAMQKLAQAKQQEQDDSDHDDDTSSFGVKSTPRSLASDDDNKSLAASELSVPTATSSKRSEDGDSDNWGF